MPSAIVGEAPRWSFLLTRFDPQEALRILTLEKEEFYGQWVTTFAGFCAWVISPSDKALIRDAMVIKAEQKYRMMVHTKRVKGKVRPSRTLRERTIRDSKTYASFFKNIYGPIQANGLSLKHRPLTALKADLTAQANSIQFSLKLLTIFHYVEDIVFPCGGFHHASVKRGTTVFAKVSKLGFDYQGGITQRSVDPHWASNRHSAAFLYTGHLISDSSGCSLLDLMLQNRLLLKDTRPYFNEWFGKANYITAQVLIHLKDTRVILPDFPVAPQVGELKVAAPTMIADDSGHIETAFCQNPASTKPSRADS
jgi:hypothetical protein